MRQGNNILNKANTLLRHSTGRWLLVLFIGISLSSSAQDRDCDKLLKSLGATFEAAKYDQVIAKYDELVAENKAKNLSFNFCDWKQKQQLYEILASAYLEIDNVEKGLEFIKKIYKMNPYYTSGDSKYSLDPFIANLKRYSVKPIIAFGFRGGFDGPLFLINKKYFVLQDSLITNRKDGLKPKLSYHVGLNLKYHINKTYYAAIEADFIEQNYGREILATGPYPASNNGFRNLDLAYNEKLRSIHFPIYAGYQWHFFNSHFVPSVYLGVYYDYLFQATGSIGGTMQRYVGNNPYTDTLPSNFPAVDAPRKDTSTLHQRIQHQVGALGGIRLSYEKRFFSAFVDFRYNYNIRKFEKPNTRYDNTLFTDYYFVDFDTRQTNIQVSLGFTYNIVHKIKKLY